MQCTASCPPPPNSLAIVGRRATFPGQTTPEAGRRCASARGGTSHIVPAHGVHAMVVGVVHPTSCHFPSLGAGRWILMATSCPGLFHPASLLCSHQSTTRSPTGQRQHRQPLLCLFRHVARQEVKHPRPCGPRIHPRGCIFCTRRTESRVCVVICLHAILLFRSIVLFLVVLFCVH